MTAMESKRVVVIDGSSGIGLATAKGAVAAGAQVIIAARTAERLERARQEIGHAVETAILDVSQEDQVRSFGSATLASWIPPWSWTSTRGNGGAGLPLRWSSTATGILDMPKPATLGEEATYDRKRK